MTVVHQHIPALRKIESVTTGLDGYIVNKQVLTSRCQNGVVTTVVDVQVSDLNVLAQFQRNALVTRTVFHLAASGQSRAVQGAWAVYLYVFEVLAPYQRGFPVVVGRVHEALVVGIGFPRIHHARHGLQHSTLVQDKCDIALEMD